jgi:hypothetical protein
MAWGSKEWNAGRGQKSTAGKIFLQAVDFPAGGRSLGVEAGWSGRKPKTGDTTMKKFMLVAAVVAMACQAIPAMAGQEGSGGKATVLQEGPKEGLKNGMKNGMKEGRKEGLKNGMKNGMKEGLKEGLKNGPKK